MKINQSLTRKIPLENDQDIMARIGFRFVWCTGPYFLLVILWAAFGGSTTSAIFTPWPSLFILAIPFWGGLSDWRRLRIRAERAVA